MNEHTATPEQIRADAERQLAEIEADQAAGATLLPDLKPERPRTEDQATLLAAARLKAIRRARRWSLALACTHLPTIGVAALSRIERGERQITIADLAELAAGYGIPIADLVATGDICDACGQEIPK